MEKISVIVPVYKVEKYLSRCVDSIINQSYSELEIILVDDGSPDNCPEICEEFSRKDARIKVIHKENGGLSSARNAGLDVMTGEFVTFIDSDDYISRDYAAKLFALVKETNADLSMCILARVDEDGEIISIDNDEATDEIISGLEALRRLLTSKRFARHIISCCKLYRAEIFKTLRFPVGLLHEDEYIIPRIFEHAQKIAVSSEALYFYTQRRDSIMGRAENSKFDAKHFRDEKFIRQDFYNYLIKNNMPDLAAYQVRNFYRLLKETLRKVNYLQYREELSEFTGYTMKKLLCSKFFTYKLRAVKLALMCLRSMLREKEEKFS